MKLSEQLWDIAPPFRGNAEWLVLLEAVRGSLADYLKLPVVLVDWWTENEPDATSWGIDARIKISISETLQTHYFGWLGLRVTRKKEVRIEVELLLFAVGIRHAAHSLNSDGADILRLHLEPYPGLLGCWSSPRLVHDEYGEWESYQKIEDFVALPQ